MADRAKRRRKRIAYLGGALALLLALVLTGLLAMQAWRLADNRAMGQAWAWLQSQAPATVETSPPW
ncbi:hypothetical protein [Billgrantia zhangzhouensis]|uniref:hypothetical protein n=1 Tax=Billgrantia zhangzhouensis TaxID=2733481 RepID=UPI001F1E5EF1|nr:hypothetical protein [Halomonas zhangzhouensis]